MIKFDFIFHSELTDSQIVSICELKAQYWKYELESQKIWLNENFSDQDVHLLLFENDTLIGYLSLVHLKGVKLQNLNDKIFGLGSVCISLCQKGKSFGLLLMHLVNYYFQANHLFGILLCKKDLVPFYEKSGWIVFEGDVTIREEPYAYCLMTTKLLKQGHIDLPILF